MGSNARYPGLGDRRREERLLREARARGPLHTLSAEQLLLEQSLITYAPRMIRMIGRAWLRFGDVEVEATVRVDRWTDRAVGVEVDIDGEMLRAWIWRGAIGPVTQPRRGFQPEHTRGADAGQA